MRLAEFKLKVDCELRTYFEEREALMHLYILFEKILKVDRAQLSIATDRIVSVHERDAMRMALDDLKSQKPIDYIFNESVFFGRDFFVDERVLIPRSETEELVQWILEEERGEEMDILDIGSGSGCISISLALEAKYGRVDAIDVSEEANQVARINAKRNNLAMEFTCMNILNQVPDCSYDIVVSNPPYVKREELKKLDKNVLEYEPEIALAPDGEPLTFYKRMIAIAPQILKSKGRFYWEIHEDLGEEIVKLLNQHDFQEIELKRDIYDRDRLVRAIFSG